MSDWIEQYSAALDARDAREQAHKPYIDAYTRVADRAAAARQEYEASSKKPSSPLPLDRTATASKRGFITRSPPPTQDPSDALAALRTDLANTQRARATLQTQVTDLTSQLSTLQASEKRSASQIAALQKQKLDVERKLRDREEEIKGKSKIVEEAQDEMVSLQLQLNIAERRREEVEAENKDLVERWMKRMESEVERVNRGSGWE
ncbi:Autophagy protein 16 [Pseudocercospora fuligena]|uniref:Autophagy protein 16 n=1 Tax=Pseudocercospora fuligena TaxID=685502 RepID=A0A8H6VPP5_9PEZI|nr:Autophagy protein 16 [Pseudocercospora fuligena]